MLKKDIRVGGKYRAKVSGKIVTVQVDAIDLLTIRNHERAMYHVTNLITGRKFTFQSAQKFRNEVGMEPPITKKMRENAEAIAEAVVEMHQVGTTLPGAMMPLG